VAIDIVVPDLGESVTEATVAGWLKQPGDGVGADEPVVELETDKATVELGAPKAGVLIEILVAEGEDVEVGAVLARLEEGAAPATTEPSTSPKTTPVAPSSPSSPPPSSSTYPDATPSFDPRGVIGSGSDGRVTTADLKASLGIAPEQLGPAVRRMLEENGLDPARIPASGRDGRITKEDVIDYLESGAAEPVAQLESSAVASRAEASEPREERVKMSRMRRTIATRLKEAQDTAAILTTFNEVDMGAVMALRKKHRDAFEAKHGVRLGFTSFFAKACVAALTAVPGVNAELDGNEIIYKRYYDIGMAVASPNGLVVPVIRDCAGKTFAEIEEELARLAARANDGSLTTEEMTGGTFSITNGGVFGSLLSTPILNRPQSGILGLHKIEERPVAVKGEVVIRPMMYLALSYDHRLIDGREAVTFLVKVKESIEDPERLLLDL
jgi:2-oxoglutarate dehydrogenase E2 component (dihydrolipoamide succinyltransferase)